MRNWRNGVAAFILLAMIGIGIANVLRVEWSAGDDVPAGSATEVNQPEGPLTLEAAFVTASTRAREWDEDAALTFASLQADWPLDAQQPGPAEIPPGGWVRFTFIDSPESGDELLSVVIERYSGEIITAETQPWDATEPNVPPVSRTGITSDGAIRIAEQSYGQAHRLQCPVQRHETDVTLLPATAATIPSAATPATPISQSQSPVGTPTGPRDTPMATPVAGEEATVLPNEADPLAGVAPRWLVTYRDGGQSGINSVELEIDANTGLVLAIRDQSLPCSDFAG